MHHFIKENQSPELENALYVVATPIGNLSDITIRALQTLASVDYIICEDTRVSSVLLSKFEITKRKLLIYNDYSDKLVRNKILNKLQEGSSLALISDAGTPLISDPGYKLVNFLRQEKQKIICVPGPSALTASISISGIACDSFLFLGFLPHGEIAKEKKLKILPPNFSFIFFEVSGRIMETLRILQLHFPARKICIARELTKLHEDIIFGNVDEVIDIFNNNPQKIRGEFVVIVEKISKDQVGFDYEDLEDEIKKMIKDNHSAKDIVAEILENFEVNKKEVYALVLKHQKDHEKKPQNPTTKSVAKI